MGVGMCEEFLQTNTETFTCGDGEGAEKRTNKNVDVNMFGSRMGSMAYSKPDDKQQCGQTVDEKFYSDSKFIDIQVRRLIGCVPGAPIFRAKSDNEFTSLSLGA